MFCFPSLWIGSLSFIHIVYVRHAENVASVADVFLALFMWLVFSSYINSLALLFSLEKYAVRFASLCCFSLFISQACFFCFLSLLLSYSLALSLRALSFSCSFLLFSCCPIQYLLQFLCFHQSTFSQYISIPPQLSVMHPT